MKERQKEPSQQKNPRKWGMILLMAVLIIVMLVSLWNILGYLLEGRKSEKFAQDLQESAIIIEKDNTDSKDTKKERRKNRYRMQLILTPCMRSVKMQWHGCMHRAVGSTM